MSKTHVQVGDKILTLTNLDKVLYPAAGFTKAEVIDYYTRIAPVMLPHIEGRPLTLKRFPDGVDGKWFFQKACPSRRPAWIEVAEIDTEREPVEFCTVHDVAGLVWLANLASLEIHPLLARKDNLSRPTALIFDLDPGPPAGLLECVEVACALRDVFAALELESFVKTSGGKGLHLFVPLNTVSHFGQAKEFAHAVALALQRRIPRLVTANMRKTVRRGKVLVDWSQNDDFKSTVAPYSLRARERPRVSTPVAWHEIEQARRARDATRLVFEAPEVLSRVERQGDPFAPVATLKQRMPRLSRIEAASA